MLFMKSKKRSFPKKTVLLVIMCLLAVGVAAAYVLREPSKTNTPEESLQFKKDPPKQFCSQEGKLCLTAPADWLNLNTDASSPHMQLSNAASTVQIQFSHDLDSKTEACAPGDCLLTVVAVDKVSALPDAALVKAVFQRKEYNVNAPSVFLLSQTDVSSYGMQAGKTIDLKVNELPTFARKLDGKMYTQHLEGVGVSPGNYADIEQAKKWFNTKDGKAVDAVFRSVRVP
jgi:hypothetical protein